jgi:anti-sigma regulatory factor (Ser/Thr protein kinase)
LSVLHEAYFYRTMADFVAAAKPFVEEGLSAGEAVLVAVSAPQIEALRPALGRDHDVTFADMARMGRNPGRIMSVLRKFVLGNTYAGRNCRGIGEPIWPGRTAAEVVECQRHEVLLNVAFPDGPPWRLMCPYNVSTLDSWVIEEAARSHPVIGSDGTRMPSSAYDPDLSRLAPRLPPHPEPALEIAFTRANIRDVREAVTLHAATTRLTVDQTGEFVLAVHELAVNSVHHGGGKGILRIWQEPGSVVCELTDEGVIADPLIGRSAPEPGARQGRGLWLANEMCDLVQIRSSTEGTVIRVHMLEQPS